MRQGLLFFLLALSYATTNAQTFSKVADLSSRIEETSGLVYVNGHLLTHNDSGGSVKLYEIDTLTGEVIDEVSLNGASLTDWEDVCADETNIYIGDFGNNLGSRTSLKIYKVGLADFFDGNDNADALELAFNYADQTDFTAAQFQTNFDAETLINYGGQLLIFSKNWGDGKTRIYPFDKDATSEQELNPIATINVNGLLTAGVYDPDRQVIVLTGYENFIPFIIEMQVDGSIDFDSFEWQRSTLQTQGGSTQVEGISLAPDSSYYLSGERTSLANPTLYKYAVERVSSSKEFEANVNFKVFPNPACDLVQVDAQNLKELKLLDLTGKVILSGATQQLMVGDLPRGGYFLEASFTSGQKQSTFIVLD